MGTTYAVKGKAKDFLNKLFDSDKDKQSNVHPNDSPTRPSAHPIHPSAKSDELTHHFDALSLYPDQRPYRSDTFVGGFQTPPPQRPSGYQPPGPLPRPPDIQMPMPQTNAPHPTSLTMQHALSPAFSPGGQLYPGTTQGNHRPSASTSYLPTPAYNFSPASSPQTSPTRPPSVKRPSASSSSSAATTSHGQSSATPTKTTKPTRKRSASTPSADQTQCAGLTKAGNRCTRQVKIGPALSGKLDNTSDDIERFCFQHSKELFDGPSGFYARKNGQWLTFDDWIPKYLQPETQLALRVEMEKAKTPADAPGYIYAFEIRDPSFPSTIKLKVGRAVNLTKRIDQWAKQCKSKEQVLRGWYPGIVYSDDGSTPLPDDAVSLMKGRVKAGEPGACCHRLERLIHLELADLIVSGIYLDQAWPNVTAIGKASAASSPKKSIKPNNKKCPDCGQTHKEIFEFSRVKRGHYAGREWEGIVKPIIEKWGGFVDSYL